MLSPLRLSALLGAIALVLFAGLGIYLAPLEPNVVALQFTFKASSFLAVIANWGPAGIALYRSHFGVDFVLLGVYAAFGHTLSKHLGSMHEQSSRRVALLTWSLPVAAVADAIEDGLHLRLTSGQPDAAHSLYAIAGLASSVKWLGFGLFVVALVGCLRKRGG